MHTRDEGRGTPKTEFDKGTPNPRWKRLRSKRRFLGKYLSVKRSTPEMANRDQVTPKIKLQLRLRYTQDSSLSEMKSHKNKMDLR